MNTDVIAFQEVTVLELKRAYCNRIQCQLHVEPWHRHWLPPLTDADKIYFIQALSTWRLPHCIVEEPIGIPNAYSAQNDHSQPQLLVVWVRVLCSPAMVLKPILTPSSCVLKSSKMSIRSSYGKVLSSFCRWSWILSLTASSASSVNMLIKWYLSLLWIDSSFHFTHGPL